MNHNNTEEPFKKSFSTRGRSTGITKIYTVAELELATNCFSEANILGEGSLGPVYRAKFPDDKVQLNLYNIFITFRFQIAAFKLYYMFLPFLFCGRFWP